MMDVSALELIGRGVAVYAVLFLVLRAAGNREFSQLTPFDLVLLLIIAEVTQQALIGGQDFSLTAAAILIVTLAGLDIALSLVKQRSALVDNILEGVPVLLIDEGELLEENMRRERVGEDDILLAARQNQAVERLDEIKYAVLERDGRISVIPWQ